MRLFVPGVPDRLHLRGPCELPPPVGADLRPPAQLVFANLVFANLVFPNLVFPNLVFASLVVGRTTRRGAVIRPTPQRLDVAVNPAFGISPPGAAARQAINTR